MRFTDFLVVLILSFCLVSTACSCLKICYRKEMEAREKEKQLHALVFISESFKNCCKGKGFETLTQWQLVCRTLWKLDYIGWCDSQEFMVDDYAQKGSLLYGKWVGVNSQGDIYCRRKTNE